MPTEEPAGPIPNVVRLAPPIKGLAPDRSESLVEQVEHRLPRTAIGWRSIGTKLLFEQLVGGVTMAGGVGQMLFDPGDLLPENFDPLAQLVDRHRAEVLLDEQGQRVAGLAREEIIFVHG